MSFGCSGVTTSLGGTGDLRLRVVAHGPRRAADLTPTRRVLEYAGVGGGETGCAVGGVAVLGRTVLVRRIGRIDPLAGNRLHGVPLGAPQLHRDRRRRPAGLDGDPGRPVIGELQVDHAGTAGILEHRRFACGRIAADVVAVFPVPGVLHTGE